MNLNDCLKNFEEQLMNTEDRVKRYYSKELRNITANLRGSSLDSDNFGALSGALPPNFMRILDRKVD